MLAPRARARDRAVAVSDVDNINDHNAATLGGRSLASITIRNLDERTKARLRIRAARCGRSMQQESRHILCAALANGPAAGLDLAAAIRVRFETLGGVELELLPREPPRATPASEARRRPRAGRSS